MTQFLGVIQIAATLGPARLDSLKQELNGTAGFFA